MNARGEVMNISAPQWDPYDSYGIVACQLARHLTRMGVTVNALQLDGQIQHAQQDAEVRAAIGHPIRPSLGGLLLGYPTEFTARGYPLLTLGPGVAVTMFESTRLPDGWAEALNQTCQAVVVPSAWLVGVMYENGVRGPVHAFPLGVDEDYQPLERREDRPYTFLAIADRGERKSWFETADAFVAAFGKRTDVRLILKTRETTPMPRLANRNIEVVTDDLDAAGMRALFARADCMVWASKGEGFGLPPREFAATGGVVLATAWSGSADDLEAWGWPLNFELVPAWPNHPRHRGLGLWAQPVKDDLVTKLRWVATRPAEAQARAAEAPAAIRRLYRWEQFAAQVWAVWLGAVEDWEAERCLTSTPI